MGWGGWRSKELLGQNQERTRYKVGPIARWTRWCLVVSFELLREERLPELFFPSLRHLFSATLCNQTFISFLGLSFVLLRFSLKMHTFLGEIPHWVSSRFKLHSYLSSFLQVKEAWEETSNHYRNERDTEDGSQAFPQGTSQFRLWAQNKILYICQKSHQWKTSSFNIHSPLLSK